MSVVKRVLWIKEGHFAQFTVVCTMYMGAKVYSNLPQDQFTTVGEAYDYAFAWSKANKVPVLKNVEDLYDISQQKVNKYVKEKAQGFLTTTSALAELTLKETVCLIHTK